MKSRWLSTIITGSLVLLGACSSTPDLQINGAKPYRAVVAADHVLASQAGAKILRDGGNAVDAAVATSFALSVVRPYSCGIGGGGFMVISLNDDPDHGDLLTAIDYREVAPRAIGKDYYTSRDRSSVRGGTAVGVPGTVAGLLYAHQAYGKLPLEKVIKPAIELAQQGFVVDAHYAHEAGLLIKAFEQHPEWKTRFSLVWEQFLLKGSVTRGDRVRAPNQAKVLQMIAQQGRAGFYQGPVARAIVHAVRKDGGDLTLDDLRSCRPIERQPVRAQIAGRLFVGMPPPSSGGVTMIEGLRIMEAAGYDFSRPPDDALALHLFAESYKHAFADRSRYFGDPDFVDVPVKYLLSNAYVVQQAYKIDRQHTQPPETYGSHPPIPDDHGTSHFSVIDENGNAVACTETINLAFGSLLGVDQFGFVLNNEMDDFLTHPGQPNAFGLVQAEQNLPQPGKRPLSSMSPTLVFDDDGLLAVAGASGGPRIITATVQVLLRVLAGASARDAVAAGRAHHQWLPNRLELEPSFLSNDIRADLENRGHILGARDPVGNVQLIRRTNAGWDAACDPRKGGAPAGY